MCHHHVPGLFVVTSVARNGGRRHVAPRNGTRDHPPTDPRCIRDGSAPLGRLRARSVDFLTAQLVCRAGSVPSTLDEEDGQTVRTEVDRPPTAWVPPCPSTGGRVPSQHRAAVGLAASPYAAPQASPFLPTPSAARLLHSPSCAPTGARSLRVVTCQPTAGRPPFPPAPAPPPSRGFACASLPLPSPFSPGRTLHCLVLRPLHYPPPPRSPDRSPPCSTPPLS